MANQRNEYAKKRRKKLIREFGGKCIVCECTDSKVLEFAHIKPTKLRGRGRGRKERYSDISKNRGAYILICDVHHKRYDDNDCKIVKRVMEGLKKRI